MDSPPGRETRPANSRQRRTSYGMGELTRKENDPLGCFLHDSAHVFADVSTLSIPVLYYVMMATEINFYGAGSATLVAWTTTTVVAALLRGGWVRPLGTDVRGWVSITPVLVGLRLVYYNLALLAAAFGGVAVASVAGVPAASFGVAVAVATATAMAFPRLAEIVCIRLVE